MFLEKTTNPCVIPNQVSGTNQQVGKVELAGAGLQLFVRLDKAPHLGLQQAGQIRAGLAFKFPKPFAQLILGIHDLIARVLRGKFLDVTLLHIAQVSQEGEEQAFEIVVVGCSPRLKIDDALQAFSQLVSRRFTGGHHLCQLGYLSHQIVDLLFTIEWIAAPGRRKIAPLEKIVAGRTKLIERASFIEGTYK